MLTASFESQPDRDHVSGTWPAVPCTVPDKASGRPSIDNAEPADLALALARRENWAAEAVIRRYGSGIERLLCRMLGSRRDVEDIAQEVYLRLFTRIDTLEDPSALGSYLYSIAVRVACWELRRRAVRRCMHLTDGGVLPEPPHSPRAADARLALLRFLEIIDSLRPEERTVFVLRRIQGLTLNQIAESLGVSVSTAKRRVVRALGRVQRSMAEDPLFSAYATARRPRRRRATQALALTQ